jgi:hypothetical protein
MMSSKCSNAAEKSIAALYAGAAFLMILGAVLFAYWTQMPPSPKPVSAPANEFSAVRALKHIREVATVTHPAGSFANDRVREYIFAQLQAAGVPSEIQTGVNPGGGTGVYHNVLARIPGTANTKAFAMAAHYDSVPYGPGATDDCGGVGVMLELARMLHDGPPLKNDIIMCFTDAEEFSGGGARSFTEHPWVGSGDVGLILNFEARGTSGPSYMFETSPDNGWLIAQMAESGVNARATSIMYDVFKKSPFGSDFGNFKRAGMKGYNIAFVGSFCNYHTRDDRPDVISLASVQHHGEYALGFARHFGGMDLTNVSAVAPDATYFNTIGGHLVHYPQTWGRPLAVIVTVLFVIMLILGLVRKHLTIGGLLIGAGAFVVSAICVAAVMGGLAALVFNVHGRYVLYNNGLYAMGMAVAAAGVILAMYTLFRRAATVQNLAAASCFAWVALLWALERYIPGGTYLAVWPPLFGMAGIVILFAAPADKDLPRGLVLGAALFALPGIFLLVPSLVGVIDMATILVSFVMGLAMLLLAGFLMPALALLEWPNRYWLPLGSFAVGLGLVGLGLVTNGPNASKPHFDCLSYGLDQDTGKAYWISNDQAPDEWLSQFIPAGTPRATIAEFIPGKYDTHLKPGRHKLPEILGSWIVPAYDDKYMKAPAPVASLGGPQVTVVHNEVADGKRNLTLHIGTAEAVTQMRLAVTSPTEVLGSTVLGVDTQAKREKWEKEVQLFPREGVDVTFVLNANDPLRLKMVEKIYGLPESLSIPPRPPHLITEPNTTLDWGRPLRSEHTFITKTFDLSAPVGT